MYNIIMRQVGPSHRSRSSDAMKTSLASWMDGSGRTSLDAASESTLEAALKTTSSIRMPREMESFLR